MWALILGFYLGAQAESDSSSWVAEGEKWWRLLKKDGTNGLVRCQSSVLVMMTQSSNNRDLSENGLRTTPFVRRACALGLVTRPTPTCSETNWSACSAVTASCVYFGVIRSRRAALIIASWTIG